LEIYSITDWYVRISSYYRTLARIWKLARKKLDGESIGMPCHVEDTDNDKVILKWTSMVYVVRKRGRWKWLGVAFLLAVWPFFHLLSCLTPSGIVRTDCTVTVVKGMSVMLVIAWLQVETINCVPTPAMGVTSHHYGMVILTQVINDSRRCLVK
jgi:hypothetical protein